MHLSGLVILLKVRAQLFKILTHQLKFSAVNDAKFSGLKCDILETQFRKYTRLVGITNQFPFVYTIAKCQYISHLDSHNTNLWRFMVTHRFTPQICSVAMPQHVPQSHHAMPSPSVKSKPKHSKHLINYLSKQCQDN